MASASLSTANTLAPSCANSTAVARPLPQPGPTQPAPVTMATLSARRPGMASCPCHPDGTDYLGCNPGRLALASRSGTQVPDDRDYRGRAPEIQTTTGCLGPACGPQPACVPTGRHRPLAGEGPARAPASRGLG